MTLARWQGTIQDEDGNIVPSANIKVTSEIAGGPLVSLYSDRDGAVPLGNPFQSDSEGFAAFHLVGGAFKIRAYKGSFERIWRYVPIGTNAERDFGTIFTPRGAWSGATTYAMGDLVSSISGGEPYAFVSNVDANLNHAPPFSGAIGTSNSFWTVVGLIQDPGIAGEPGSSDVVGTSVSSVAIGTGTKTFTIVEDDRGWGDGARVRISSDANPTTHYMEGVITSYAGNTLQVSVDIISGSGSRADWTINIAGEQGQDGSAGTNLKIYGESSGTNTIVAAEEGTHSFHIFKAGVTNTGAATYNGRPLKNKAGGALRAGEIQVGTWYGLVDDGTNYYVVMSGAVL